MGRPRKTHGEAGDASLELVILAPAVFAILALVIAAGRTSIADGAVAAAARDAARQASLARTPGAAQAAALASASAALRQDGLDCSPQSPSARAASAFRSGSPRPCRLP